MSRPVTLATMLRAPGAPDGATISYRRVLFWSLVGAVIVAGIILYFRYGRSLTPLVE